MELRDYLKIIGKHAILLIVITIITAGFAFFWTKLTPKSYTASTTFTVNKSSSLKQSTAPYYLFDNYYNVQSAGLYSQTVATWFESPALVKEIYSRAEIGVPDVSQKKLSRIFRAIRQEPSTVSITVGGTNKEELEKLIVSAYEVVRENTATLGKNSEFFYEIAQFAPVVTEDDSSLVLNTLIGLVSGALVGIILAFAIEYFKPQVKE